MTIHIWMHWFWITSVSRKSFLIIFTINFLYSFPCIVEAGLHNDNSFNSENFNVFDNNLSYEYTYQTSQNEEDGYEYELSRKRRHIEDEADFTDETTLPPASSPSFGVSSTETLTNNEATSDIDNGYQKSSSDSVDTYNGGSMDLFSQYPVKKFSKYADYAKFGKSKVKPKTSDGETVINDRNVETLKIIREKIDINVKQLNKEAINIVDNENVSRILATNSSLAINESEIVETTTEITDNLTTVVIGNAAEVRNDTSLGDELVDEPVLSDEPIKNDRMTENVSSQNETVKNIIPVVANVTNVTEDQKMTRVVQNETEITVENKVDESVVHPTVEPFMFNNRVAAATSSETKERLSQSGLDAGSITGITLGIVVISGLFGAISFVLYRRRYLNKPQALNDKSSNLDSSGYIDDSSFRENSEEMYSLDNDSFLNSLEAMTIQNYWTENVKHTKL